MNWKEYIDQWLKTPVRCLSTATTGVHDEDELIAVSTKEPGSPTTTIIRSIDVDKLEPAMEYHRITPELVRERGMQDNEFKRELSNMVGGIMLSYNPAFHVKYISALDDSVDFKCVDIVLIWKAANANLAVSSDMSLQELQAYIMASLGKANAFKRVAASSGFSDFEYLLPCENSACAVEWIYSQLALFPLTLL